MRRLFQVLFVFCVCAPVFAGEIAVQPPTVYSGPAERLIPHSGGWWNQDEAGSGYFIEFMRNADDSVTGFGTVYTYNPDGTSTFLIVQGLVQFASEAERNQNGIIARFSSDLFKAADGQPFGGAYRPASVTPSGLGTGEFVFFTRRTGELRTNSRNVSIRALSPLPSAQEYVRMLSGTWALNAVMRRNPELQSDPAYERMVSHVVRIQPSEIQPTWEPGQYVELPGGGLRLSEDSLRQFWRPSGNVLLISVIPQCA